MIIVIFCIQFLGGGKEGKQVLPFSLVLEITGIGRKCTLIYGHFTECSILSSEMRGTYRLLVGNFSIIF